MKDQKPATVGPVWIHHSRTWKGYLLSFYCYQLKEARRTENPLEVVRPCMSWKVKRNQLSHVRWCPLPLKKGARRLCEVLYQQVPDSFRRGIQNKRCTGGKNLRKINPVFGGRFHFLWHRIRLIVFWNSKCHEKEWDLYPRINQGEGRAAQRFLENRARIYDPLMDCLWMESWCAGGRKRKTGIIFYISKTPPSWSRNLFPFAAIPSGL